MQGNKAKIYLFLGMEIIEYIRRNIVSKYIPIEEVDGKIKWLLKGLIKDYIIHELTHSHDLEFSDNIKNDYPQKNIAEIDLETATPEEIKAYKFYFTTI